MPMVIVPLRVLPSNVVPPIWSQRCWRTWWKRGNQRWIREMLLPMLVEPLQMLFCAGRYMCFLPYSSLFRDVADNFALFLTNSRQCSRCLVIIISFSRRTQLSVWVSAFHMNCALKSVPLGLRSLLRDVYRDNMDQVTAKCFRPPVFFIMGIPVPSFWNRARTERFPVLFLTPRIASLALKWSFCPCFSPCLFLLGLFILST